MLYLLPLHLHTLYGYHHHTHQQSLMQMLCLLVFTSELTDIPPPNDPAEFDATVVPVSVTSPDRCTCHHHPTQQCYHGGCYFQRELSPSTRLPLAYIPPNRPCCSRQCTNTTAVHRHCERYGSTIITVIAKTINVPADQLAYQRKLVGRAVHVKMTTCWQR